MKLFFTWIVIFYSHSVWCQNPYSLTDASVTHRLLNHLSYQIDSSNRPFRDVISQNFVPLSQINISSKKNVAYWIKAEVRNETGFDQFILTTDQWGSAIVWVKEGSEWKSAVSGTTIPVERRPTSLHRILSFPVKITPGETKTIYIRVQYTQRWLGYFVKLYSFLSKVELDEASHAYQKYSVIQVLVAFVLGALAILFFYNLISFFFNREWSSLILSGYLFINGFAIANSNGIATNYLLRNATGFELPLGLLLGHIIPILMAIFLIRFLTLGRKNWEYHVLLIFISLVAISMAFTLFTHVQFLYLIRRYIVYLALLLVSVVSVFKKRQGAYILLLALLVTIVTSFFAEFKSVFFNNIAFTGADRPYLFGILAQMLILTVAARYQVQSLEKDFESIREEQRNLIEKKNDELKVQVEEKTKQLKDALKTLEQKKDQLETANQDLLLKSDSIQTLNQKLEQLVVSRTQALQSTMHDLDTFLYRASHDLRRPLMTISGIVNLVMKEKKVDKIHELMLHVNKTVTGLDRMLKKLIAISFCYTEGIDKEPVEIVGLIQGVSRSIAHEYSLRENQIQVTAANPHAQLNSNAYLLKMIVDCLLENAVQYHSNGEVLITIVVENHGKACLIKIIDRGEGIESTRQRQIFDMFFRAHEKSDGNGLGLYLVKIGVEKLGGSVDLTSQVGQGTEIRLLF